MTHSESRERRARMAQAVRDGLTVAEIAAREGVPLNAVRDACKQHGVNISNHVNPRTLSILAAILNTSETFAEIARRFGVSRSWVELIRNQAVSAGIVVPPHREKTEKTD